MIEPGGHPQLVADDLKRAIVVVTDTSHQGVGVVVIDVDIGRREGPHDSLEARVLGHATARQRDASGALVHV